MHLVNTCFGSRCWSDRSCICVDWRNGCWSSCLWSYVSNRIFITIIIVSTKNLNQYVILMIMTQSHTITALYPRCGWIAIRVASSPISSITDMKPVCVHFCWAPVSIISQSTAGVSDVIVSERKYAYLSWGISSNCYTSFWFKKNQISLVVPLYIKTDIGNLIKTFLKS